MAKAKRVFEVAKELGVTSKAIVEKCKAEDVPGITNHMSTVKLGLEHTIRQWFSEEVDETTAVETAKPVDLKKVRAKAKPKAKSKSQAEEELQDDEGGEVATVTEEAPDQVSASDEASSEAATAVEAQAPAAAAPVESEQAQPPSAAEPQPPAAEEEPQVAAEAPAAEPVAEAPAAAPEQPREAAAPAPQARAEARKEDEAVQAKGIQNVPNRPDVVKPAGEQLAKPKEAKLSGPRVVRIEEPEPVRQPKPRRGPAGPAGAGTNMPPGTVAGISRSRGPARGKGVGGGGAGGFTDDSPVRKRRSASSRRSRVSEALPTGPGKFTEQDLIELESRLKRSTGFIRQRRRDMKKPTGQAALTPAQVGGKVEIQEPITIKGLSSATGIKAADIIKFLFTQKGIMATINSAIDTEAAMEIALEYDIELEVKAMRSAEQLVEAQFQEAEQIDVRRRPPVVAVLGHVDHGKTSLLDRIREEDVAAHEAGGITQHIGAYRVTVKGNDAREKTVVFLDTPGHEAFTSMRARGANITDIVVLVVAADDGVMPQTIESINHAKAAGVPIVVALNKIDRPDATDNNIQKIYGQLAEHGLNPTEWGGETEIIKTSAIQGTGITDLLDVLDYQAELLELQADWGGPARGIVIEAEMQEGRGPVARILMQQGQMDLGNYIVTGRAFGRVRDMTDDHGRAVTHVGPATPLEISGIDRIPDAGDKFYVVDSLKKAEDIAHDYREAEREAQLAQANKVTLDNFAATLKAGAMRELRVVLKADVQGSVDVLRDSLTKLGNEEVTVKVLHAAVGGVTENDVKLAEASEGIVLGFHVVAVPAVRDLAEEHHVDVRTYRVIYELIDDVKKGLEGLLEPERREEQIGEAEVKEVFSISKVGSIAGCLVTEGAIQRTGKLRLVRNGVVVTDERKVASLRRVKDDVREVQVGTECGIRIEGFDDVKAGDTIICYRTVEIARKLA